MIAKIKDWFQKLLFYEHCAHRFALACSVGVYIAFSPFIGLHTAMIIFASWFFALNFTIMWVISHLINNPWTMVPVYGAGYAFGDWFLNLFGVNHTFNPLLLQNIIGWISYKTGFQSLSFWGFLVGGNILGLVCALLAYPFIKRYAQATKVEKVKNSFEKSKSKVKQLVFKAVRAVERGTQKATIVCAELINKVPKRPHA